MESQSSWLEWVAIRVMQVINSRIVQPDVRQQKVPVLRQETLDGHAKKVEALRVLNCELSAMWLLDCRLGTTRECAERIRAAPDGGEH